MYPYLYDNYSKNEILWISFFVFFISILPIFLFTTLDLLQLKYLEKYRIDYGHGRKYPPKKEIVHSGKYILRNLICFIVPVFILIFILCNIFNINPFIISRTLPTLDIYIIHILGILLLSEILLYMLHRIMHDPDLYNTIHKIHHKYTETFALVNYYMHPLELFLFMAMIFIPPILFHSHIAIFWISIIIINWNGIIIHSGYNFTETSLLRIKEHDIHHKYFNYNYGVMFTFMDYLCNTYYRK